MAYLCTVLPSYTNVLLRVVASILGQAIIHAASPFSPKSMAQTSLNRSLPGPEDCFSLGSGRFSSVSQNPHTGSHQDSFNPV
jgi:hypothetical protein